jgi:hypothetical protein
MSVDFDVDYFDTGQTVASSRALRLVKVRAEQL